MSVGVSLLTTEQMSDGGANVNGTAMRFRQLDGLHHNSPLTVRSSASNVFEADEPGAYAPVSVHSC